MKQSSLRSILTCLFAALISVGTLFIIPVGPVPLVLQNAFAILSGLILGPIQGAGAVGLFLIAGALGLPVFSGGRGGYAVLAGPTGGYLAGYFIGALVSGYLSAKADNRPAKEAFPILLAATLAGFAAIYVPGVLVLRSHLHLSLQEALTKGLLPFIPADLIKVAIILPVALKIKPLVRRYIAVND